MVIKNVEITDKLRINSHTIGRLVYLTNRFKDDIKIIKGDKEVNAKSIMGVITLGIDYGDTLKLVSDNKSHIEQLAEFIEGRDIENTSD